MRRVAVVANLNVFSRDIVSLVLTGRMTKIPDAGQFDAEHITFRVRCLSALPALANDPCHRGAPNRYRLHKRLQLLRQ